MITAIDTNVLIDLFRTNSPHHSKSRALLRQAYDSGAIVICDVVYAEIAPHFAERVLLDDAVPDIGAALLPIDSAIAYEAGMRWKLYRAAGGPRERIITDFLIGAHAVATADVFLTRDRGFFSTYFPELKGPVVS